MWDTFTAVQEELDELAEADETLEDDERARGKELKNYGRKVGLYPGDVEQFEAIVGTFAVVLSLMLSKKHLLFTCGSLSCTKKENEIGEFKRCGRCKLMWYCSRDCQVKSWKEGHKKICGKKTKDMAETAASG